MSKLDHFPLGPHPSISVSAKPIPRPKTSRAPVVNPYDKFSQPEFDAWIGDMTSALRRSLGYEQERQTRSMDQIYESTNGHPPEYHPPDASDQDEEPNDSFALIKSRRAKGKARDPREGPGFGKGDRMQPIEIPSSDEEEEEVAKDLTFGEELDSSEEEDYDEDDDEDDDEEDDEEEEEDDEDYDSSWKYGESSSKPLSSLPIRFGPPKSARKLLSETIPDDEEQVEDEEEDDGGLGHAEEEYDGHSEGEYDPGSRTVLKWKDSPEVIDLDSEDVDPGAEKDDEKENRVFTSSQPSREPPLKEYASDVEGIEEDQPSDDDTAFPPHRTSSLGQLLEIRDPWEAPRRYTADLYTGGDIPLSPRIHADVDHIGTMDDKFVEEGDEVDISQHSGMDKAPVLHVTSPLTTQFFKKAFATLEASPMDLEAFYPRDGSRRTDSSLFAVNEAEDGGINSFLTPGVIIPNQSEMRSYLDGHSNIGQELDQGSIESAPQNISTLSSHPQRRPPPQGVEIIAIEDSDDETTAKDVLSMEDNLEVIPPSGYIAEWHTAPGDAPGVVIEEVHAAESSHDIPFAPVIENIAPSSDEAMGGNEILSSHTAQADSIEVGGHGRPIEFLPSEITISENAGYVNLSSTPVPDVETLDDRDDLEDIYGSPVPEDLPKQEAKCDEIQIILSTEEPAPSEIKDVGNGGDLIMEQTSGVDLQDGGEVQTVSGQLGHLEEFRRPPTPSELPDDVSSLVAFKTHESDTEFENQINNDGGDAGFETTTRHPGDPVLDHNDGEEDMTVELNDDVEVQTVASISDVWLEGREDMPLVYTVEEPVTEGRLTEERSNRSSLDVESITTRQSATPDGLRDAVSTIGQLGDSEVPMPPAVKLEQKEGISSSIRVSPLKELHTVPGQPRIPMPVTADANVPDPTESPTRRRVDNHVGSLPIFALVPDNASNELVVLPSDIPYPAPPPLASNPFVGLSPNFLVHHPRIQTDGLFTPAEPSTTTTPAELTTDLSHDEAKKDINVRPTGGPPKDLPVETENLVDLDDSFPSDAYLFAEIHQDQSSLDESVHVSSTKDIETTPLSPPAALSQRFPSVSLHVPLSRKSTDPILMADPYPYSLSTPGASEIPDGEDLSDDNTMDNSMSFDSTTEKGMKDQVGKDEDILAGLELPQRSQSDLSTQLEMPCATHPDETKGYPVKEIAGETQTLAADVGSHPAEESKTAEPDAKDLSSIPVVELIRGDETHSTEEALTHSMNLEEQHSQDPFSGDQNVEKAIVANTTADDTISQHDSVSPTSESGSGSPEKLDVVPVPRSTKRKRDLTSDSSLVEGSTSKTKGKKRRKSKNKGRAVERPTVQPREEDTIYVKPRQAIHSRAGDVQVADSQLAQSSSGASSAAQTLQAAISPGDAMEVSAPLVIPVAQPQLQFRPATLFHAHGRKRQNVHKLPQLVTRHIPVNEPPPPCRPAAQQAVDQIKSPAEPASTLEPVHKPVPPTVPASMTPAQEPSPPHLTFVVGFSSQPVPNETATADQANAPHVAPQPPLTPVTETPSSPPGPQSPSVPLPSPMRAAPPLSNLSTNTRSMRSRCMYHRISLPREEGGPRVYFLVPGCSLSNHELMAHEQIEDHGGATYEDSLRMIRDIESLLLNQYLIGIIRQLVGLDILREGEVFYLPQPGEDVPRKQSLRKSISERSTMVRIPAGGEYSSSYAGSPGSLRSASTKPPLSNADSTSTSLSAFRKMIDSEKGSTLAATDSEFEVDEEESKQDAIDVSTSSAAKPKRKKGRARKVKAKDTPYQPAEKEEDSGEEELFKKRARKPTRPIKRTRTIEVGAEGERKSKRLKTQLTAPL